MWPTAVTAALGCAPFLPPPAVCTGSLNPHDRPPGGCRFHLVEKRRMELRKVKCTRSLGEEPKMYPGSLAAEPSPQPCAVLLPPDTASWVPACTLHTVASLSASCSAHTWLPCPESLLHSSSSTWGMPAWLWHYLLPMYFSRLHPTWYHWSLCCPHLLAQL